MRPSIKADPVEGAFYVYYGRKNSFFFAAHVPMFPASDTPYHQVSEDSGVHASCDTQQGLRTIHPSSYSFFIVVMLP